MYVLLWDEAGDKKKQVQSVATLLSEKENYLFLENKLQELLPTNEIKFARVRLNDSYLQQVKQYLDHFFDHLNNEDSSMVFVIWKSNSLLYKDMYEEVFLLSQSMCDDEISFTPDQNNVLQRRNNTSSYKEFGITSIQELNSEENKCIQLLDIIAGLLVFFREHYGTYEIRRQSSNRYEQLEDFERELHMRCELMSHFFALLQKHYGPVTIFENGAWGVDSERVIVLEY